MFDPDALALMKVPGLQSLHAACPVPVRVLALEDLGRAPMVPVSRAAGTGGMGTLVYDIALDESGEGYHAVPVAVILPYDQFTRLRLIAPPVQQAGS